MTEPRIVAFAKDWEDVPTCITHVFRGMGRTIPLLWLDSIGTRKPNLGFSRDTGRILRRLQGVFKRAERKENMLRVLSPVLIPQARSPFSARVNRFLFEAQVGRELADMGKGPIEYWCSVPNAVDLVGAKGRGQRAEGGGQRALVVYYCVDDWGKFANLDGGWLNEKEGELLARADIVFTPARYLKDKCEERAPVPPPGGIHYVPHGVEFDKFAAALDETLPVPPDIALLPRPVIGFYGNVYPWIDFGLVKGLAEQRPEWSFVMIGHPYCDISGLASVSNIHFLGRREHSELPAYCRGFDAAMIPYDLADTRMESVNPVKTRELLAAGVPVVASDIPELRAFGEDVKLCRSLDEWIPALEHQVARRDRAEISGKMASEDWKHKITQIREKVDGLL
ncbi:MAG: glycosyltransferase [Lentisphaerae bacterium]|nr:glycosyltransferase [Lentisphaerota bacterium]